MKCDATAAGVRDVTPAAAAAAAAGTSDGG